MAARGEAVIGEGMSDECVGKGLLYP